MTNWKADPKVQEAIQNLTTMHSEQRLSMRAMNAANIDALCEAVAASRVPHLTDTHTVERERQARATLNARRMFISKCQRQGVTGVIATFYGAFSANQTITLSCSRSNSGATLNNDDPSPRMRRHRAPSD